MSSRRTHAVARADTPEAFLATRHDDGECRECDELRRWLHDRTLQMLEYIAAGGYADREAAQLRRVAAVAADDLRGVVEGGAPEHAPTLVSGLIDVVSRAQLAAGGLAIELQVGRIEQELPRELVRPVATAAEEALANVRKHAHAERAIVACEVIGDCARVTVRDDGVGFEPAHAELGSGLRFSILKRLLMCGGSARVQSRPGEGAVVTLEVRLKPTTTPAAG